VNRPRTLLKQYFDDNSIVKANIDSFNEFIDNGMQEIVDDNRLVEPTIIPPDVDDYKIFLDKVWVGKPEMIEADGSKRKVFPSEARLRKLSYSAPIYMEVSSEVNGVQRESIKTQVGKLPIMLKSKYCHLNNMDEEELINHKEDPGDPGGYFIVNGTEKIVVGIEDLAANKFTVEEASTGVSDYVGKVFSSRSSYKIPHNLEKRKDGIFYLTFTRVNRMPIVAVMKALGLTKDKQIMDLIGMQGNSEILLNLLEFNEIKSEEEAIDYMAKKIGITQSKEARQERVYEILDQYLLPHIGGEPEDRLMKAKNLCKYLRKFILVEDGELETDDKDHYLNKRLKLAGDLMGDLFRVNLKVLVGDMLYNFQRQVKRGKSPSIKVIIREKLLTQRLYSSMATGNWVGGRKGVSQRIERLNFLQAQSHLQRVVSPLSSRQENFEARALHPTHLGRLCPSETPEGTNIGLRKNQSLLARASTEADEDEITEIAKNLGLEEA
jgi:DNA-directed RNA polymerase subunit B